MISLICRLCIVLSVISTSGCGSQGGPVLHRQSGSVVYKGEAVEQGYIVFISTDGDRRQDGGAIVGGAYQCQVAAGDKKVEITANRHVEGKKDAKGMAVTEQYIPKNYNSASTLTVNVASAKDDLDFDLD